MAKISGFVGRTIVVVPMRFNAPVAEIRPEFRVVKQSFTVAQ